MLGLFIVVTYVEQRFIVLPNTAGKKELYGSNPCYNNSELGYCFNFYGRCFIRVYEDKRPVIKMETVSQFTIIIN